MVSVCVSFGILKVCPVNSPSLVEKNKVGKVLWLVENCVLLSAIYTSTYLGSTSILCVLTTTLDIPVSLAASGSLPKGTLMVETKPGKRGSPDHNISTGPSAKLKVMVSTEDCNV